uniref:TSA: Wollemia nobilis Ref_Wollemi_Transcript_13804_1256 transcribed RNA sequence n=1 Tax=Wollemia nobilis TaxID=56998 RepID=A0A0C9RKF7_9CONI
MFSPGNFHQCQGETELPVVDLSTLLSEPEADHLEIENLRKACEQWGVFRVVNHGIEEELIRRMDSVSRHLFSLPPEVKERAVSPRVFEGYCASSQFFQGESMSFPGILASQSLEQYTEKLWPQGNPEFCETLRSYSCKLSHPANSVLKLILHSWGLNAVKYFRSDFEGCEVKLLLNYLQPCEESQVGDVVRFKAHKDFSVMAILYNDEVGGLQIRSKQGDWFNMKPLPGSLLVIVGDGLKIWSNDRCWSAEHRVVYGERKPRLSAVLFWNFPPEKEVRAPEDLIDEKHPQRYKPFLFKDYRDARARGAHLDIVL